MAKTFAITVRSDFPVASATLTVSSDDAMSKLLDGAAKALNIQRTDLAKYGVSAVAYKQDVIDMTGSKDIKAATAGCTIFFAAPGDIKPARRPRKKKGKDKDEKELDLDDSRYKGLTPSNVLGKFLQAKAGTKQSKIYVDYIGENFQEILGSNRSSLLKWPVDKLKELLSADAIDVETEGVVFKLAMDWVKASLKGAKQEESPENIKKAFEPLVSVIRFPCMNSTDLAAQVMPSGILDSQIILELFTWVGKNAERKDDDKVPKLEGALKNMNAKPRSALSRGINAYVGMYLTSSATSYFEGKRWTIAVTPAEKGSKRIVAYADYLPWSSTYQTKGSVTGYKLNGEFRGDGIYLNDGTTDYNLRVDKSSTSKNWVLAGSWNSTQGNGSGEYRLTRQNKTVDKQQFEFLS